MRYFIDTEFIEGFFTSAFSTKKRHYVDLISIGIVAEDGRSYYAISREYRYSEADKWVKENVILPMYIDAVHGDARNRYDVDNFHLTYGKSNSEIVTDALEFMGCWRDEHFWRVGNDIPEIYGYYADYDWVVFCSLFGRMIDLPKGFPMYCRDLKQMMDERGLSKEWKKGNCPEPENEHNALADAKWNKELYEAIQKENINNEPQSVEAIGVQPDNKIFTKEDARVLLNNFQEYAQAHEIDPPYSFSTLVNKWIDDYTLLNRPNQEAMGEKPEANWKQLRDKFFKECVDIEQFDQRGCLAEKYVINIAPHDLFEWFKKELQSVEAMGVQTKEFDFLLSIWPHGHFETGNLIEVELLGIEKINKRFKEDYYEMIVEALNDDEENGGQFKELKTEQAYLVDCFIGWELNEPYFTFDNCRISSNIADNQITPSNSLSDIPKQNQDI